MPSVVGVPTKIKGIDKGRAGRIEFKDERIVASGISRLPRSGGELLWKQIGRTRDEEIGRGGGPCDNGVALGIHGHVPPSLSAAPTDYASVTEACAIRTAFGDNALAAAREMHAV